MQGDQPSKRAKAGVGTLAYAAASAFTLPLSVAKEAWKVWRGQQGIGTSVGPRVCDLQANLDLANPPSGLGHPVRDVVNTLVAAQLQRLGWATCKRQPGPLLWFHAATVAECAVALPVLLRCLTEYNEKVNVMLTTASQDAYELLQASLPPRVIIQLVPLDNPVCASLFMKHWRPQVGILMESPFYPNLVLIASVFNVRLTLLNAHIPSSDLLQWHAWRSMRTMLGSMLNSFSLIVPQSDADVGRFRIFGTPMKLMPGWCSDLKYAAALASSVWHLWRPSPAAAQQLRRKLAGRQAWLAANTQPGEEEVVANVHATVCSQVPAALCVLVPKDEMTRSDEVCEVLMAHGLSVTRWSEDAITYDGYDVLLVDVPGLLPLLYSVCELVLMGNSLVEGAVGQNLSEAAVAGCAIVLGPHGPAGGHMGEELNSAAVAAAEEAAAAVRSTGHGMEDAPMWGSASDGRAAFGSVSAAPGDHYEPSPAPHAAGASAEHPTTLAGGGSSEDLSGSHAGTHAGGAWAQISSPDTAPGHTAAQRALHFGGVSRQQSGVNGESEAWVPPTSYPSYMPHVLLDTASSEEGERSPVRYLLSPAALPPVRGDGQHVLLGRVSEEGHLTPSSSSSTSGHPAKDAHDMQGGSPAGLIPQRDSSAESVTMVTPFWHRRPQPGNTSGARSTPATCEITPVESDSPGVTAGSSSVTTSTTPVTAPAHGGATTAGPYSSARPSTPPLTAPASTTRLRHAPGSTALRNTLTSQQLHAQFREGWGLGPASSGGPHRGSGAVACAGGITGRGSQQAAGTRPELWDELFAATGSDSFPWSPPGGVGPSHPLHSTSSQPHPRLGLLTSPRSSLQHSESPGRLVYTPRGSTLEEQRQSGRSASGGGAGAGAGARVPLATRPGSGVSGPTIPLDNGPSFRHLVPQFSGSSFTGAGAASLPPSSPPASPAQERDSRDRAAAGVQSLRAYQMPAMPAAMQSRLQQQRRSPLSGWRGGPGGPTGPTGGSPPGRDDTDFPSPTLRTAAAHAASASSSAQAPAAAVINTTDAAQPSSSTSVNSNDAAGGASGSANSAPLSSAGWSVCSITTPGAGPPAMPGPPSDGAPASGRSAFGVPPALVLPESAGNSPCKGGSCSTGRGSITTSMAASGGSMALPDDLLNSALESLEGRELGALLSSQGMGVTSANKLWGVAQSGIDMGTQTEITWLSTDHPVPMAALPASRIPLPGAAVEYTAPPAAVPAQLPMPSTTPVLSDQQQPSAVQPSVTPVLPEAMQVAVPEAIQGQMVQGGDMSGTSAVPTTLAPPLPAMVPVSAAAPDEVARKPCSDVMVPSSQPAPPPIEADPSNTDLPVVHSAPPVLATSPTRRVGGAVGQRHASLSGALRGWPQSRPPTIRTGMIIGEGHHRVLHAAGHSASDGGSTLARPVQGGLVPTPGHLHPSHAAASAAVASALLQGTMEASSSSHGASGGGSSSPSSISRPTLVSHHAAHGASLAGWVMRSGTYGSDASWDSVAGGGPSYMGGLLDSADWADAALKGGHSSNGTGGHTSGHTSVNGSGLTPAALWSLRGGEEGAAAPAPNSSGGPGRRSGAPAAARPSRLRRESYADEEAAAAAAATASMQEHGRVSSAPAVTSPTRTHLTHLLTGDQHRAARSLAAVRSHTQDVESLIPGLTVRPGRGTHSTSFTPVVAVAAAGLAPVAAPSAAAPAPVVNVPPVAPISIGNTALQEALGAIDTDSPDASWLRRRSSSGATHTSSAGPSAGAAGCASINTSSPDFGGALPLVRNLNRSSSQPMPRPPAARLLRCLTDKGPAGVQSVAAAGTTAVMAAVSSTTVQYSSGAADAGQAVPAEQGGTLRYRNSRGSTGGGPITPTSSAKGSTQSLEALLMGSSTAGVGTTGSITAACTADVTAAGTATSSMLPTAMPTAHQSTQSFDSLLETAGDQMAPSSSSADANQEALAALIAAAAHTNLLASTAAPPPSQPSERPAAPGATAPMSIPTRAGAADTFPTISLSTSPLEVNNILPAVTINTNTNTNSRSTASTTQRALHRSLTVPSSVLQAMSGAQTTAGAGASAEPAHKSNSAPAELEFFRVRQRSHSGRPSFEFPPSSSTQLSPPAVQSGTTTTALPRTVSAGSIALMGRGSAVAAPPQEVAPTAGSDPLLDSTTSAPQLAAVPDLETSLPGPSPQQVPVPSHAQVLPAPEGSSGAAGLPPQAPAAAAAVFPQQQQVSGAAAALQLLPRVASGASEKSEAGGRSHSPRRMAMAMRWLGGSSNGAAGNLLDSDGTTSNGGAGRAGSGDDLLMATFGEIALHRCGSSSEASTLSALASAALGAPPAPTPTLLATPTPAPSLLPAVADTAALLDTVAGDADALLAAQELSAQELTAAAAADMPDAPQPSDFGMDDNMGPVEQVAGEFADAALATIDLTAISLLPPAAAAGGDISGEQGTLPLGTSSINDGPAQPSPSEAGAGSGSSRPQPAPLQLPLAVAAISSSTGDANAAIISPATTSDTTTSSGSGDHGGVEVEAAPLPSTFGRCSSPSGKPGRISIEGWVSGSGGGTFSTLPRTRSPSTSYILAFASVAEGGDEAPASQFSSSSQHPLELNLSSSPQQPRELQPDQDNTAASGAAGAPEPETGRSQVSLQPCPAPAVLDTMATTATDAGLGHDVFATAGVRVQRRQARSQEHPTVAPDSGSGSEETPHLGGHSHTSHSSAHTQPHTSGRRAPYRTVSELLPRAAAGFTAGGFHPHPPPLSAENSSSHVAGGPGEAAPLFAPFEFLQHLRSRNSGSTPAASTLTASTGAASDAQQGTNLLAVPRDSSSTASTNSSAINSAGGTSVRPQHLGASGTLFENGGSGRPPLPSPLGGTTGPPAGAGTEQGPGAGPLQRVLRGHRRATAGTGGNAAGRSFDSADSSDRDSSSSGTCLSTHLQRRDARTVLLAEPVTLESEPSRNTSSGALGRRPSRQYSRGGAGSTSAGARTSTAEGGAGGYTSAPHMPASPLRRHASMAAHGSGSHGPQARSPRRSWASGGTGTHSSSGPQGSPAGSTSTGGSSTGLPSRLSDQRAMRHYNRSARSSAPDGYLAPPSPRAVRASPSRSAVPLSPRASVAAAAAAANPLSPRAAVPMPPPSPRARPNGSSGLGNVVPPMSPRARGTAGSAAAPPSPRAVPRPGVGGSGLLMPPASPRTPRNAGLVTGGASTTAGSPADLTLDQIVALARSHVAVDDDWPPAEPGLPRQSSHRQGAGGFAGGSAMPDTPTSRVSALGASASPFANAVFDRPHPFRSGLQQSTGPTQLSEEAELIRLAQTPAQEWPSPSDHTRDLTHGHTAPQVTPDTPTSRFSGTATSPFANPVFDRPHPFSTVQRAVEAGPSDASQATTASGAALHSSEEAELMRLAQMGSHGGGSMGGHGGIAASQAIPDTPTSRLSVTATSPFANPVYDRPHPFGAHGVGAGSVERHTCLSSVGAAEGALPSSEEAELIRLAQTTAYAGSRAGVTTQPGGANPQVIPDTPTSRLSGTATSPFANPVFDRPHPFASAPQKVTGPTLMAEEAELVRLAQMPAQVWRRDEEDVLQGNSIATSGAGVVQPTPDTPTSLLSVTATSPFAGAVFDRPCPFRLTRQGSHIPVSDLESVRSQGHTTPPGSSVPPASVLGSPVPPSKEVSSTWAAVQSNTPPPPSMLSPGRPTQASQARPITPPHHSHPSGIPTHPGTAQLVSQPALHQSMPPGSNRQHAAAARAGLQRSVSSLTMSGAHAAAAPAAAVANAAGPWRDATAPISPLSSHASMAAAVLEREAAAAKIENGGWLRPRAFDAPMRVVGSTPCSTGTATSGTSSPGMSGTMPGGTVMLSMPISTTAAGAATHGNLLLPVPQLSSAVSGGRPTSSTATGNGVRARDDLEVTLGMQHLSHLHAPPHVRLPLAPPFRSSTIMTSSGPMFPRSTPLATLPESALSGEGSSQETPTTSSTTTPTANEPMAPSASTLTMQSAQAAAAIQRLVMSPQQDFTTSSSSPPRGVANLSANHSSSSSNRTAVGAATPAAAAPALRTFRRLSMSGNTSDSTSTTRGGGTLTDSPASPPAGTAAVHRLPRRYNSEYYPSSTTSRPGQQALALQQQGLLWQANGAASGGHTSKHYGGDASAAVAAALGGPLPGVLSTPAPTHARLLRPSDTSSNTASSSTLSSTTGTTGPAYVPTVPAESAEGGAVHPGATAAVQPAPLGLHVSTATPDTPRASALFSNTSPFSSRPNSPWKGSPGGLNRTISLPSPSATAAALAAVLQSTAGGSGSGAVPRTTSLDSSTTSRGTAPGGGTSDVPPSPRKPSPTPCPELAARREAYRARDAAESSTPGGGAVHVSPSTGPRCMLLHTAAPVNVNAAPGNAAQGAAMPSAAVGTTPPRVPASFGDTSTASPTALTTSSAVPPALSPRSPYRRLFSEPRGAYDTATALTHPPAATTTTTVTATTNLGQRQSVGAQPPGVVAGSSPAVAAATMDAPPVSGFEVLGAADAAVAAASVAPPPPLHPRTGVMPPPSPRRTFSVPAVRPAPHLTASPQVSAFAAATSQPPLVGVGSITSPDSAASRGVRGSQSQLGHSPGGRPSLLRPHSLDMAASLAQEFSLNNHGTLMLSAAVEAIAGSRGGSVSSPGSLGLLERGASLTLQGTTPALGGAGGTTPPRVVLPRTSPTSASRFGPRTAQGGATAAAAVIPGSNGSGPSTPVVVPHTDVQPAVPPVLPPAVKDDGMGEILAALAASKAAEAGLVSPGQQPPGTATSLPHVLLAPPPSGTALEAAPEYPPSAECEGEEKDDGMSDLLPMLPALPRLKLPNTPLSRRPLSGGLNTAVAGSTAAGWSSASTVLTLSVNIPSTAPAGRGQAAASRGTFAAAPPAVPAASALQMPPPGVSAAEARIPTGATSTQQATTSSHVPVAGTLQGTAGVPPLPVPMTDPAIAAVLGLPSPPATNSSAQPANSSTEPPMRAPPIRTSSTISRARVAAATAVPLSPRLSLPAHWHAVPEVPPSPRAVPEPPSPRAPVQPPLSYAVRVPPPEVQPQPATLPVPFPAQNLLAVPVSSTAAVHPVSTGLQDNPNPGNTQAIQAELADLRRTLAGFTFPPFPLASRSPPAMGAGLLGAQPPAGGPMPALQLPQQQQQRPLLGLPPMSPRLRPPASPRHPATRASEVAAVTAAAVAAASALLPPHASSSELGESAAAAAAAAQAAAEAVSARRVATAMQGGGSGGHARAIHGGTRHPAGHGNGHTLRSDTMGDQQVGGLPSNGSRDSSLDGVELGFVVNTRHAPHRPGMAAATTAAGAATAAAPNSAVPGFGRRSWDDVRDTGPRPSAGGYSGGTIGGAIIGNTAAPPPGASPFPVPPAEAQAPAPSTGVMSFPPASAGVVAPGVPQQGGRDQGIAAGRAGAADSSALHGAVQQGGGTSAGAVRRISHRHWPSQGSVMSDATTATSAALSGYDVLMMTSASAGLPPAVLHTTLSGTGGALAATTSMQSGCGVQLSLGSTRPSTAGSGSGVVPPAAAGMAAAGGHDESVPAWVAAAAALPASPGAAAAAGLSGIGSIGPGGSSSLWAGGLVGLASPNLSGTWAVSGDGTTSALSGTPGTLLRTRTSVAHDVRDVVLGRGPGQYTAVHEQYPQSPRPPGSPFGHQTLLSPQKGHNIFAALSSAAAAASPIKAEVSSTTVSTLPYVEAGQPTAGAEAHTESPPGENSGSVVASPTRAGRSPLTEVQPSTGQAAASEPGAAPALLPASVPVSGPPPILPQPSPQDDDAAATQLPSQAQSEPEVPASAASTQEVHHQSGFDVAWGRVSAGGTTVIMSERPQSQPEVTPVAHTSVISKQEVTLGGLTGRAATADRPEQASLAEQPLRGIRSHAATTATTSAAARAPGALQAAVAAASSNISSANTGATSSTTLANDPQALAAALMSKAKAAGAHTFSAAHTSLVVHSELTAGASQAAHTGVPAPHVEVTQAVEVSSALSISGQSSGGSSGLMSTASGATATSSCLATCGSSGVVAAVAGTKSRAVSTTTTTATTFKSGQTSSINVTQGAGNNPGSTAAGTSSTSAVQDTPMAVPAVSVTVPPQPSLVSGGHTGLTSPQTPPLTSGWSHPAIITPDRDIVGHTSITGERSDHRTTHLASEGSGDAVTGGRASQEVAMAPMVAASGSATDANTAHAQAATPTIGSGTRAGATSGGTPVPVPASPSVGSSPWHLGTRVSASSVSSSLHTPGGRAGGTSYMRFSGSFILPATALPRATGPAVWRVGDTGQELASAIIHLLKEPMERRSRGHAAAQGAAKLTDGLVSTVWHVVDDTVIAPALHEYVQAQQGQGQQEGSQQ